MLNNTLTRPTHKQLRADRSCWDASPRRWVLSYFCF